MEIEDRINNEEKIKRYKFYLNQIMDKTQVTMSMLNFGGEN